MTFLVQGKTIKYLNIKSDDGNSNRAAIFGVLNTPMLKYYLFVRGTPTTVIFSVKLQASYSKIAFVMKFHTIKQNCY